MVRRREYRVEPAAGDGWAVYESGRRVDTQPTKARAKRKARRMARVGDELVIKDADGRFQDRRTIRQ